MLEQHTNDKEQTKCKIKIFIRFRPTKLWKERENNLKTKFELARLRNV